MSWDEELKSPVRGNNKLVLTILETNGCRLSLLSLFYLVRLDRYLCTFSCLSSLAICSGTPSNNAIPINKISLDHFSI